MTVVLPWTGVSEVVQHIRRPFDIKAAHKPFGALRSALFNGKDYSVDHNQPTNQPTYATRRLGCDKQLVDETD